jgi:hypothetical protein
LIQTGGLGILTLPVISVIFLWWCSTYENQLTFERFNWVEQNSEVFSALKQVIILITFTIEFFCRDFNLFQSRPFLIRIFVEVYFSVFHSVSVFVMLDFPRLVITFMKVGTVSIFPAFDNNRLFCVGLGFPIVVNLFRYVKYFIAKKNVLPHWCG